MLLIRSRIDGLTSGHAHAGIPSWLAKDGQVTLANWDSAPPAQPLVALPPSGAGALRSGSGGDTGTVMSLASRATAGGRATRPPRGGRHHGTSTRVLDDTYTDGGRRGARRPDLCAGARGGDPARHRALAHVDLEIGGRLRRREASLTAGPAAHPTQLVTDHVPELAPIVAIAARACATCWTCGPGIKFSEQYTDLEAEVRVIEQAMGLAPVVPLTTYPRSMYGYLTTLTQGARARWRVRVPVRETDVLGWVCERAAGTRMANLIADRVRGADRRRARCGDHLRRCGHRRARRRDVRHAARTSPGSA